MNQNCQLVLRTVALFPIFLILTVSAIAQPAERHIVESKGWQIEPATPAEINRRIDEAAVKYSEYAPVPRVAFYDIAYPKDSSEYLDLDGNAVLVITVLSQEQAELPLKRVYVSLDGSDIELKPITLVLSKQANLESQSAKTFGRYRADAIYLIPVYLCLKNANLVADFAKNRTAFKVGEFSPDVPPDVASLPIKRPGGTGPSKLALMRLLQREYPGFIREK